MAPSPSARERAVLADALAAAGPDAPTLCEGWTARDLAAHLVTREGRVDAALGVAGGPLAGRSERLRRAATGRPYSELVDAVRSGPPRTSPFRVPGVDALVNLVEHAVHAEDVLRARSGWTPRVPDARVEEGLWRSLAVSARPAARRSPGGLVLEVPGGPQRRLGSGSGSPVVLRGRPLELVLWLLGRDEHARVEVDGPGDVAERLPTAA